MSKTNVSTAGPTGDAAAARGGARWYYGWNIVAVCVLSQFAVSGLTVNAFSLFLRDWSEQLHAPVSTFALGFSAFGLITALLAPLSGILADRYPARRLFGAGLLVMAGVCLAMSFVTSGWQFVALYAVPVSISISLAALVPSNAVVSRWFTKRIGLALGLTALGQGLPGVILPPMIAAALPTLGWRIVWRIGAFVIGVVLLPIIVFVLRDRPADLDGVHYGGAGGGPDAGAASSQAHAGAPVHGPHTLGTADLTWRDMFARPSFWVLVMIFLAVISNFMAMASNLGPIAASHGFGPSIVGMLLSVFNLSQIAATFLAGVVSDRHGNRVPLAGLSLLSGCGSLLIAFGSGLAPIALGVAFVGIGGGFWPLLAAATTREFGAGVAGRAFGLISGFMPIVVVTPFMIAKTEEITGSYALGLSAVAALGFIGGALCLLLMRERARAS